VSYALSYCGVCAFFPQSPKARGRLRPAVAISLATMPSAQIKPYIAFISPDGMRMLMARRLITSGFTVNGYDINPVTTTALEYANGKASTSLALATTNASIMTLMVAKAEDGTLTMMISAAKAGYVERSTATLSTAFQNLRCDSRYQDFL
jgi:hypothetical protein